MRMIKTFQWVKQDKAIHLESLSGEPQLPANQMNQRKIQQPILS